MAAIVMNTQSTTEPMPSADLDAWRMVGWAAPIVFAGMLALGHTQALDWALRFGWPLFTCVSIMAVLALSAAATSIVWTLRRDEEEDTMEPSIAAVFCTFIAVVVWLAGFVPLHMDGQMEQPTRWHTLMAAAKIERTVARVEQAGPAAATHPDNALLLQAVQDPTVERIRAAFLALTRDRPVRQPERIMGLVATVGLGDRPEYRQTLARGWMRLSEFRALQQAALHQPELARANAQAGQAYQELVSL